MVLCFSSLIQHLIYSCILAIKDGCYNPFGFEIEVHEAYDHWCRRLITKENNLTVRFYSQFVFFKGNFFERSINWKRTKKVLFRHEYKPRKTL